MRHRRFRKRSPGELVKNLLLMVAFFGTLIAIFGYSAGLPLLGVLVFVGIFVAVVGVIVTVLLAF